MTPTRRFVLAAVILPAVIATVAVLIAWSWRDQLPDPVATHWGSDGVDGFTARTGLRWHDHVHLGTGRRRLVPATRAG